MSAEMSLELVYHSNFDLYGRCLSPNRRQELREGGVGYRAPIVHLEWSSGQASA